MNLAAGIPANVGHSACTFCDGFLGELVALLDDQFADPRVAGFLVARFPIEHREALGHQFGGGFRAKLVALAVVPRPLLVDGHDRVIDAHVQLERRGPRRPSSHARSRCPPVSR